jgi:hypothetical protein
MACRWIGSVLLACALAACGGGGGGDDGAGRSDASQNLQVSVHYEPASLPLFAQARLVPVMNGFGGHAPVCTLLSGSVPEGTRLESDCSITGRPIRVEHALFFVRVGAAGVANTLDFQGVVNVFGPRVRYGLFPSTHFMRLGQEVSEFPQLAFWSAPPDVPLTWNYSVVGGSLPDGITLDPATGLIQGAPRSLGEFSAQIQATVSTPFGSYRAEPTPWVAVVEAEGSFFYSLGGRPLPADAIVPVELGEPLALFPGALKLADVGAFTDFRISGGALPAGLTLNPASGEIRGTPTEPTGTTTFVISANKTTAGVRTQVSLSLEVRAPVTVSYQAGLTAQPGTAVEFRPQFRSGGVLPIGVVAVGRAGSCSLPTGIEIRPTNGAIAGATSVTGTYECVVDFTLTHGSATWTQPASFQLVVQ